MGQLGGWNHLLTPSETIFYTVTLGHPWVNISSEHSCSFKLFIYVWSFLLEGGENEREIISPSPKAFTMDLWEEVVGFNETHKPSSHFHTSLSCWPGEITQHP